MAEGARREHLPVTAKQAGRETPIDWLNPRDNRIEVQDQPTNLALVDLTYDYDPAGNISNIDDGVRQEERTYQYDFLDRLTFAGVYAGQQMIEERYYTYNQIGNLLFFRHRYPSAGQGRGAWAVGGSASADGKALRGSFNTLSSNNLSSTNHALRLRLRL